MNLFDLAAKLTLDTKDYKKGLNDAQEETQSKASKIGSLLKGAVGTVAKVSAAATVAAGTAIGKIVKDSVDAYGEYQQLVGGIEKLYGDATDRVKNYANEAYKTVGMSAGQYMSSTTAFTAKLVSDFSGDTVMAADYADKAMRQIADNANTFGKYSAGELTQVYQALARGSYMTLDNLSLGFSGTKAGMEELLETASKVTGITYDIDNFSDVIDAIGVVQDQLNITGTTAREAAGTIQGSIGMTKAAWQNLITGLSDSEADINQLVSNLITSAGAVAKNIIPTIKQALSGIGTAIVELAPAFADGITGLITDVLPGLVKSANTLIVEFSKALIDNIDAVINAAFEIIDILVKSLSDPNGLILLVDAAFQIISKLAEGLVENLPKLLPAIVGIVIDIADKLTSPENLTSLLDAAIAILLSLADGLIASIDMLLDKAPELIDNLVYALIVAAPKLIEAAAEIILKLSRYLSDPNLLIDLVKAALQIVVSVGEGIIQAIPELIGVVFQMVGALAEYIVDRGTDIVNAAKRLMNFFTDGISQKIDDIKQWGRNIIDGFVGGILEKWDALKRKISGIVDSVKNIFTGKKGFDTHSPSKWAKEVFANVLEGGEAGITSELPNALKTAGEAVDAIQDEMIPTAANLAGGIVTEELSVNDGRGNASAQILELLTTYLPTLAAMRVYLDSGALVGELAPGMDAALGRRASYAARGMA